MKTAYGQLRAKVQVFDFSHNIAQLYQEADLVIARARAGTIFELSALGKPAILIPYPYAYGHQKKNGFIIHHLLY